MQSLKDKFEELRQHHVPAQVGDVRELFGPGQNPRQEPQGIFEGLGNPGAAA